jgi:hypothetical protein
MLGGLPAEDSQTYSTEFVVVRVRAPIRISSPVVTPATDGTTRAAENHENHADERQDEADGLQDRDVGDVAHQEKNDAENYHLIFLTAGCAVAHHCGLMTGWTN